MGSIQISSSEEEGPDPEVAELFASIVISNQSQLLLWARLAQGRGSSSLGFCSLTELQLRAAARAQVSPAFYLEWLPANLRKSLGQKYCNSGRVTE